MGFLIDAVMHSIDFRAQVRRSVRMRYLQMQIWLRLIVRTALQVSSMGVTGCRLMQAVSSFVPRPVVDGVDSQA